MVPVQPFRRWVLAFGALVEVLTLGVTAARAQEMPLANLLPELILREIVLESPIAGLSHVAHFSPLEANEPNNPVVGIVQGFNSQMATQFSTFPLGSSSRDVCLREDDGAPEPVSTAPALATGFPTARLPSSGALSRLVARSDRARP
jgi:hypothetical protein